MKRKVVRTLLCASVITAMAAGAPMCAMAEAAAETVQTEEAQPTEEAEVVIEDITVTVAAGDVTIENKTEKNYTAEYAEIEKAAEEGKEPEKVWALTLTDDEDQTYVFEDVKPEEWKEPALVDELGILYIKAKDANGADLEAAENCEEKALEEKVSIYATTDVNIREKADTQAPVLKVCKFGEECQAVAAVPGWIKVELEDGKEGYISHKYVTSDKEEIEKLKKAAEEAAAQAQAAREQAAREQAAADAAWQEQQSQQAQYQEPAPQQEEPAPQPAEPAPVYEVSREKFDDCDGSGHGYYEITYSDGSVSYEEY